VIEHQVKYIMSCRLGRPVGAGNKNGNKVEQFFGMKPGSCPATICGKDNKEYKKLTKKMAAQKKEMENHKKRQEKRILHGDLLAANVQADDDWFSKYLENPATESTEPPKPSRPLTQQTLSWGNINNNNDNNNNKRPFSAIDSSTAVKKKVTRKSAYRSTLKKCPCGVGCKVIKYGTQPLYYSCGYAKVSRDGNLSEVSNHCGCYNLGSVPQNETAMVLERKPR